MDWKRIVRQLKMFGVEPVNGFLLVRCPECAYMSLHPGDRPGGARRDFTNHWNWAHLEVPQTVCQVLHDVRRLYQPYIMQNRGDAGQAWPTWRTSAWGGP
jgi:hypothetical protein